MNWQNVVGGIARCETFGARPRKKTRTGAQKKGKPEGKNRKNGWEQRCCFGQFLGGRFLPRQYTGIDVVPYVVDENTRYFQENKER